MDEFASETDSDYTSYWRDWVSAETLAHGRKIGEEFYSILSIYLFSPRFTESDALKSSICTQLCVESAKFLRANAQPVVSLSNQLSAEITTLLAWPQSGELSSLESRVSAGTLFRWCRWLCAI